jgi:hypothetical protein
MLKHFKVTNQDDYIVVSGPSLDVMKKCKAEAIAKFVMKEIRSGNKIDAVDAREVGAVLLSNILSALPRPRAVAMFYPYGDKVEIDYN